MKRSRTIGILVGTLAVMELAYILTSASSKNDTMLHPVAEMIMGVDTDESFLRTMIDRQKAAMALVERELRLGDHAETRQFAAAMLESRKKELTELQRLEAKARGRRI